MNREDRKRLLEVALQRAQAGSGSTLSVVREEHAVYGWGAELPELGDLRYMIVGGLATALYMPERMTIDTDLLILSEDLEIAEGLLKKAGGERAGSPTIGGSSWRLPGEHSLDLIALDQPWVQDALSAAVQDEHGRPFASLPFLVLMKLESGRLQDLADISRMLGCAKAELVDEVRSVLAHYRPQDLEDFESMLRLGRLEHE
ncbi:MAG: hypothetical protein O2923_07625 [Verrucomicrobia bacterium]|nr:hypothetical protein [Verrucomicrobiota bacterium]MDA1087183.1 hypothetical protein [Verrucomicrobiota bacterium]